MIKKTPRDRRLESDYKKINDEFSYHPYIKINFEKNGTELPEKYIINYKGIKGVKLSKDSTPENRKVEIINEHKVEINLHLNYPKLKPQCYMISGIFHPNIRSAFPHDICTGDFWAPGETICDIIYLIGEMIMFQNYNIKSPLNGIAAKWAKENEKIFPIDKINLKQPDIKIDFIKLKN